MTTLTSFDEGMPCWVDVMVLTQEQHLDKRAFLSALFDWTWQEGGPEMGHYDLALSNGHPVMGLGVTDDGNGAPTTYFSTKEINAAVSRATDLGASAIVPAMEV